MDKFVTRKPRSSDVPEVKPNERSTMRQATIESLQGVVVVEEIRRAKAKLKLESTSIKEMVECLEQIGKKVPSRQVMLDTKIGKVVNRLRRHENQDVQKAAKRVYVKWKTHFVDHMERPQIEVKCDLKTERMRTSAKKMLADALSVEITDTLPEVIEMEAFHSHRRLINHSYRRTMRTLVFTLRNNEEVRKSVLDKTLTVTEFVKSYIKE